MEHVSINPPQPPVFGSIAPDRINSASPPLAPQIKSAKHHSNLPLGHYITQSLEHSWMRYAKRVARYQQRRTNRHVHDLRIAIRQLIANLDAVKLVIPSVRSPRIRSTLKKELKILGDLRDAHLEMRRLDKFTRLTKDLKKLRHHLRNKKAKWEQAFSKFQNNSDLAHLFALLIKRIDAASDTVSSDRTAHHHVQHQLHKRLLRVIRMQPRSASKKRRLHSARIALKQYCYLADVFSRYLHGVNRRAILRLKRHQEIMGELHDLHLFAKRFKAWLAKKDSTPKKLRAVTESLHTQKALLGKAYLQSARRLRGPGKHREE